MVWPVGKLATIPAIKDMFAPSTAGKLLDRFPFSAMLTGSYLACFLALSLVFGPVLVLALGTAIGYCVAARTIQMF
jgi:hypothetical protein